MHTSTHILLVKKFVSWSTLLARPIVKCNLHKVTCTDKWKLWMVERIGLRRAAGEINQHSGTLHDKVT